MNFKAQPENTIIDIKNPMYMFKGRLDTNKQRITELEDRSEEIISKEVQRSKGQKIKYEKG